VNAFEPDLALYKAISVPYKIFNFITTGYDVSVIGKQFNICKVVKFSDMAGMWYIPWSQPEYSVIRRAQEGRSPDQAVTFVSRRCNGLAGTPPQTSPAPIRLPLVTTAPADTIAPSPMETPDITTAVAPMVTLLPI
jgi:hypothetical protein